MARKQSKRAEILAKIREIRAKIEDYEKKIRNSMVKVEDAERVIRNGVFHDRKGVRLIDFQTKKLKYERQFRIQTKKQDRLRRELNDLECDLMETIISLSIEPGWRWVRDYEGIYVWSTDVRVGRLSEDVIGERWTIRLLKPVSRTMFQLSKDGASRRASFSTISRWNPDSDVLIQFVDGDPMKGKIAMMSGKVWDVVVRDSLRKEN